MMCRIRRDARLVLSTLLLLPSYLVTSSEPKFFLAEIPSLVADIASSANPCNITSRASKTISSGQYSLANVLVERLRVHRRRTNSRSEAAALFLAFPNGIYTGTDRHTNCGVCSRAISDMILGDAGAPPDGRLVTAVSVPKPRFSSDFGNITQVISGCDRLWTGSLLQNATVLSIEGSVPQPLGGPTSGTTRTRSPTSCAWRDNSRRGWTTTQDWTYSVPYPQADRRLLTLRSAEEVRAYQLERRSAPRPTFCVFVGTARTKLRSRIMSWLDFKGAALPGSRSCDLAAHDGPESVLRYTTSKYCLQPPGTTQSRHAFFQSISAGCVPVHFAKHWTCAFYDVAYRSHLPPLARHKFGAGTWSVLLNETRALEDPSYIEHELRNISPIEYGDMQHAVTELIPRVTYFQHSIQGVPDAADLIVDVIIGQLGTFGEEYRSETPTAEPEQEASGGNSLEVKGGKRRVKEGREAWPVLPPSSRPRYGPFRSAPFSFVHISKCGGATFIAWAHRQESPLFPKGFYPENVSNQEHGAVFDIRERPDHVRLILLRSPRAHMLSMFKECRYNKWGMRVWAKQETEGRPSVPHNGTHLADFKEWIEYYWHPLQKPFLGCYNPWNYQSRYLVSDAESPHNVVSVGYEPR